MHITHITHNSDVRQSHFTEMCEKGTLQGMTPDQILHELRMLEVTHERIASAIGKERSVATKMMAGHRAMKAAEIPKLEMLIAELRSGAPTPNAHIFEPQRPWDVPTAGWPRDVPVLGTAMAADYSYDDDGRTVLVERMEIGLTDVIQYAPRSPSMTSNRQFYAVYVNGSSMEPKFDPGDLIYVDPRRPPAIGDYVVVQLRDGNGHDGADQVVCAMVKRLVKKSPAGVTCTTIARSPSIGGKARAGMRGQSFMRRLLRKSALALRPAPRVQGSFACRRDRRAARRRQFGYWRSAARRNRAP